MLAWRGQRIKFEIVREGRITVGGAIDPQLRIPILSVTDQFAEKLLANADRCLDRSVAYRDAIDLGFLLKSTAVFPGPAISKAETAYGEGVPQSVAAVLDVLSNPAEIEYAAKVLQMAASDVWEAAVALQRAAADAWPDRTFNRPQDLATRYAP